MKNSKVIHRKLGKHKAWGLASDQLRTIELDVRLKGYRHLLYLLHEHYHVQHPEWSETKVRKESSATAKLMWSQHYRRVDLSKQ